MNAVALHIQKLKKSPSRTYSKRFTPRHIIIKPSEAKIKYRIKYKNQQGP